MRDLLHDISVSKIREAIEKRASFWGNFTKALAPSNIGRNVGEGLLAAGTAAAVTGLGVAAAKGIDLLREKIEKPRAFRSMIEATPGLAKQDAKAVQMTFNTLYSLNPQMARDPLVAGSFVGRNVGRAEMTEGSGAYVDPQTVKLLSDVGSREEEPIQKAWASGAQKFKMEQGLASSGRLQRYRKQLGSK